MLSTRLLWIEPTKDRISDSEKPLRNNTCDGAEEKRRKFCQRTFICFASVLFPLSPAPHSSNLTSA